MSTTSSSTRLVTRNPIGKQALVIGASMAGMLAARVLSDYFDQVTLIERDKLPSGSEVRKGVPQARHNHVLLIRGQKTLERYFPNFTQRLDEAGAPYLNWLSDVGLFLGDGWIERNDLNIVTRTTTRPNLEWIVRQELAAIPNISFKDNCQVNGLVENAATQRITGLSITHRRHGEQSNKDTTDIKDELLSADLVVDASGRNSKAPTWLEALGYSIPQELIVDSKLGYASALFDKLSFVPDWKFIGINAKAPHQPRGGSVSLQEGGKWMVTLMGYGKDHQPPTNLEGFLAFAKGMPSPEIYEAIKTATLSSTIRGYADTMNVWHRYDLLKRMPDGLIVMGDAACCFNPIYGQGMTTAALAAETLDSCLGAIRGSIQTTTSLSLHFQRKLAKVIANPWLLATGADFQFPETQGKRPGGAAGIAQAYFDRLLALTHRDPEIAATFIQVLNMVKPPLAMFAPSLIVKVLIQLLQAQSKPVSNSTRLASRQI